MMYTITDLISTHERIDRIFLFRKKTICHRFHGVHFTHRGGKMNEIVCIDFRNLSIMTKFLIENDQKGLIKSRKLTEQ